VKVVALLVASGLLLLAGCGGGDEEAADGNEMWTATIADNISQRDSMKPGSCPPELKKALRKATEVAVAGEGPISCARSVVADKLPPKGERPPAVDAVPPEAEGPVVARVAAWYDNKGWGSLTAPEAPGGIFVHFSVIEGKGYRSLEVGQMVEVEYTEAVPGGQDGNAWVAERVTPRD
jgi:CspA family cold shock protein